MPHVQEENTKERESVSFLDGFYCKSIVLSLLLYFTVLCSMRLIALASWQTMHVLFLIPQSRAFCCALRRFKPLPSHFILPEESAIVYMYD